MKRTAPMSALSKLTVAIGLLTATAVHAADQLDTIVVTATKLEADVQKTPIALTSLSGDQLTNLGASSVQDVAKLTPGLQLDQTGSGISATIRIRGIGTPGYSALDPSVPVFIDGVAQARTGSGFQDLIDIARVEVLRGPQGTLYGRNSTAGAINVWTKDVNTRTWDGSVQSTIGNYNDRELKGTLNVPLIDDMLGTRISLFSAHQDGYLNNPVLDTTENGFSDRYGARAKTLLTPSDSFSVLWLVDYSNVTTHNGGAMLTVPAALTAYANSPGGIVSLGGIHTIIPDDHYNGNVHANAPDYGYDTNFATSFTLNWDIESGLLKDSSITSISAYDLYKDTSGGDQDHSILDYAMSGGTASTNSWSEELRLSSDAIENFQYVAGLYYYADRVVSDQVNGTFGVDSLAAYAADPAAFGSLPHNAVTHDWFNADDAAVFGQGTYSFTNDLNLTAGIRESWAQKRGNSHLTVALPGGGSYSTDIVDHATLIETDTSGVLKLSYQIDPDKMVYGSMDRGFKPGGFNRLVTAQPNTPTTYDKEDSTNYEIGTKTQWLNNRLQANMDVFYMEFKGYHNQITDEFSNLIIENIPKVTSDGVEFDVSGLVTPDLTAGVSGAYVNPRVREVVKDPQGYVPNLEDGELINDASQYSASLYAQYTHNLPNSQAQGFVGIDDSYRSRYILGNPIIGTENTYQGGYQLTNLRAGVRNLDEHWQLTGWIKNVFNKEYAISGGTGFAGFTDGLSITQGAPRTYGMTVQYDY